MAKASSWRGPVGLKGKGLKRRSRKYLADAEKAKATERPEEMSREEEDANRQLFERAGVNDFDLRRALRDKKSSATLAAMLKKSPDLVKVVFSVEKGHGYETDGPHGSRLRAQSCRGGTLAGERRRREKRTRQAMTRRCKSRRKTASSRSCSCCSSTAPTPPFHAPASRRCTKPHWLGMWTWPRRDPSPPHRGHVFRRRPRQPGSQSASICSTIRRKSMRPDGAERKPMDYAAANGRHEVAVAADKCRAPVVVQRAAGSIRRSIGRSKSTLPW